MFPFYYNLNLLNSSTGEKSVIQPYPIKHYCLIDFTMQMHMDLFI